MAQGAEQSSGASGGRGGQTALQSPSGAGGNSSGVFSGIEDLTALNIASSLQKALSSGVVGSEDAWNSTLVSPVAITNTLTGIPSEVFGIPENYDPTFDPLGGALGLVDWGGTAFDSLANVGPGFFDRQDFSAGLEGFGTKNKETYSSSFYSPLGFENPAAYGTEWGKLSNTGENVFEAVDKALAPISGLATKALTALNPFGYITGPAGNLISGLGGILGIGPMEYAGNLISSSGGSLINNLDELAYGLVTGDWGTVGTNVLGLKDKSAGSLLNREMSYDLGNYLDSGMSGVFSDNNKAMSDKARAADLVDFALNQGFSLLGSFGGLNSLYDSIYSNPGMAEAGTLAGLIGQGGNLLGDVLGLFGVDASPVTDTLGLITSGISDIPGTLKNVLRDSITSGIMGEPQGMFSGLSNSLSALGLDTSGTEGTTGGGLDVAGLLSSALGMNASSAREGNPTVANMLNTYQTLQNQVNLPAGESTPEGGILGWDGQYYSPEQIANLQEGTTMADATTDSVRQALNNALVELLLGNNTFDTNTYLNNAYAPVQQEFQEEYGRQQKLLEEEMAQRGLSNSGIYLQNLQDFSDTQNENLLNTLSELSALAQETQLDEAYRNKALGIEGAGTSLADALNWANLALGNRELDLSAYQFDESMDAAADESLGSGIGSILGTLGIGSGGLTDLIGTGADLIGSLFGGGGGTGDGLLSGLFGGGGSSGSSSGSSSTYVPTQSVAQVASQKPSYTQSSYYGSSGSTRY